MDLKKLELLQRTLARKVRLGDDFNQIKFIGGVDQAFNKDQVISGVVVLDNTTLEVVESASSTLQTSVPYIPGYLSFREAPAILKTYRLLSCKPDMLLVDSCGVNHPRGIGLASHIGVLLNVPTIGVSKGILCGNGVMPENVGEAQPLYYNGRQVGWLVKSTKKAILLSLHQATGCLLAAVLN